MGYDCWECLICYCRFGGNNGLNTARYNMCATCFLEQCPKGLSGRAMIRSFVRIVPLVHCDFCQKETVCLYQVNVCTHCLKELDLHPSPSKNSVLEDVCDGQCNCPSCFYNDMHWREAFTQKGKIEMV